MGQGQDRAEPGQVNEGNDNEEKEEGGNKEIPWKGIKGQEIKKGPFSAEEKAILERAASQLAEERVRFTHLQVAKAFSFVFITFFLLIPRDTGV